MVSVTDWVYMLDYRERKEGSVGVEAYSYELYSFFSEY